ncbi:RHS repeat-associated core domain-containing protein [Caballeronia sp. LZ008]|uniref:RHS repeat-associated core domain-containing protein n=1 Tax=unclassified Caballeronia TaxID=2646786 RepID=UPI0020294471|nr:MULTISPECIES: RHS repeat-associated core domain-containing protein [unclassified Caballeronia]MDR5795485.1 RHS repeat-associated core domain-containing protein [Caballeronia sp. LZ008]
MVTNRSVTCGRALRLAYNRHRYYESASGRFITQDPIGLAGGTNLYAYAPSPVQWLDPLGLSGTLAGRLPNKAQSLPASQRPNAVAVIVSKDGRIVVGRKSRRCDKP